MKFNMAERPFNWFMRDIWQAVEPRHRYSNVSEKNIYDDFKLKKSLGLHDLYKIISALCGLNYSLALQTKMSINMINLVCTIRWKIIVCDIEQMTFEIEISIWPKIVFIICTLGGSCGFLYLFIFKRSFAQNDVIWSVVTSIECTMW